MRYPGDPREPRQSWEQQHSVQPSRLTSPPAADALGAPRLTQPPQPAQLAASAPVRRVNWWLRYTSWGWEQPIAATLAQRERARRSRIAAWLILGLFCGMVILSPLGWEDARARVTLAIWAVGLLGATMLNRSGRVTLAGLVLVALISGGLLFANLASPIGLTMGELPNFDAYVVAVVVAATVLPRGYTFLVAGINTLLIVGDYLFQPHNANIAQDAALYSSVTVQTVSLLVRPVALQLLLAVVAYLWVRGAEDAIRRADRAEEIALLEHQERERTFTLEEGVRYLHQTLSEWQEGDIHHRIPAMPVAILEQVRADLNTFIERFGPSIWASFHLYRLQQEAQRLTAAIEDWARGYPTVWPEPSGTPLDRAAAILRLASQGYPVDPSQLPPLSTARGARPTGGPAFGWVPQRRQPTGAPLPEILTAPNQPDWSWWQPSGNPWRYPADPADPIDPTSQPPPAG